MHPQKQWLQTPSTNDASSLGVATVRTYFRQLWQCQTACKSLPTRPQVIRGNFSLYPLLNMGLKLKKSFIDICRFML